MAPRRPGRHPRGNGERRRWRKSLRRPSLPTALVAFGRRVGLPVSEVTRYWITERRALALGFAALLVAAVADLSAGVVLGEFESDIAELPGLLLLIPAAIAMRGATFGSLGARLGTAIHIGQFQPTLRRGSYLWWQLEAAAVLTLVTSLQAAVLAALFGQIAGQQIVGVWDLIAVSVIGGVLASVVLTVVTVALAITAYRRGWNMDDVGAPAITATGDLLAIPALLVATVFATRGSVTLGLGITLTLLVAAATGYGWFHPRPEIRRLVRESVGVLTIAATVSVLAGLVLEARKDLFLSLPALLILFPGFVAMFGSLGGILSSRLTSKLHLGLVEPRVIPGTMAALDFSVTYLFGFVVFAFVGAATHLAALALGVSSPGLGALLGVSVLGGLFGTTILSAVSYTAAAATYRFGLDPDNHAIPIVTSAMDFFGMLCLVAALALLQVG